VAKLTLGMVRDIATRRRPWTIRIENANTGRFWLATGRAMDEEVECSWGDIGVQPKVRPTLTTYDKFEAMIDEKLLKGYDYVDTDYIRMSPENLATVQGYTCSNGPPVTTTAPSTTVTATIIKDRNKTAAAKPVTFAKPGGLGDALLNRPDPVHVNPSVPHPFGYIRWLRPAKGGGWEALDSNKVRLLDLPLDSGKTMLRDFADRIEILT
jgi:hypothetical protein